MVIITIAISQLIFSFCRTINVRYTANGNILGSVLTSTLVKVSWLFGSALGIQAMTTGDIIPAATYVMFGVLGDYLSMKVKIK